MGDDYKQFKTLYKTELETLKKSTKDMNNLVQSATLVRQHVMLLHESCQKFVVDMKKVGQQHSTSLWGSRINDFAADQDKVLKALNDYQLSLWDNMIWPMLSSTEGDQKEVQNVEKNAKQAWAAIKKEKKSKKKKGIEYTSEDVFRYFQLYRDNRVNKWAKCIGGAVMAERTYHATSCEVLKRELWNNIPQPDSFGSLEELVKSPNADRRSSFFRRSFSFNNNDRKSLDRKSLETPEKSPQPERKEDERSQKRILKQGQLLRISGKPPNTTKKSFWFVLFEDGILEYYTDPNTVGVEKPQISINLPECIELDEDVKTNAIVIHAAYTTYSLESDTDDDFVSWFDHLKQFVKVKSTESGKRASVIMRETMAEVLRKEGEAYAEEERLKQEALKQRLEESEEEKDDEIEITIPEYVADEKKEEVIEVEVQVEKEEKLYVGKAEEHVPTMPAPPTFEQEEPKEEVPKEEVLVKRIWEKYYTHDMQEYWYNPETGETQWEEPL